MNIWELFPALRIKARYRLLHFKDVEKLPDRIHGDYDKETMTCRISQAYNDFERHWTFYHELLHALSDAYDINLTESQVEKLETAIRNVYRYNIGFTLDPP